MILRNKNFLAAALALVLLFALLLLSSLSFGTRQSSKAFTVLNDVQLYVPPPSPPPAPKLSSRQSSSASPQALELAMAPQQVELGRMKLDTSTIGANTVPTGNGLGGIDIFGDGLGAEGAGAGGFGVTLSVNQLDAIPGVLSAPMLLFPEKFRRTGIRQFQAVFHIIVDETGKVHPVRVMQSPDPELNERLLQYAEKVVFTPPMKSGKAVRAEYAWPVMFTDRQPARPRR